jgi:3',5'-nucleoside bisphosphate phosphatase
LTRQIDLHTHTTASDGSLTPAELIAEAQQARLKAISITDHDTFAGYDEVVRLPQPDGLRIVCGVELSVRPPKESDPNNGALHLLGYFPKTLPSPSFRQWLGVLQDARRDRNRRLSQRLAELGMEIPLSEVEQLGRSIAGRAHFDLLMLRKRYIASYEDAFTRYLGERGVAYVHRQDPPVEEAIERIREAGGVSSLAHPVRIPTQDHAAEERLIARLAGSGLQAIEAHHSDHEPEDVARYLRLAEIHGLAVSAGSDFHGQVKPEVKVGSGRNGNLSVSLEVLERLREAARL